VPAARRKEPVLSVRPETRSRPSGLGSQPREPESGLRGRAVSGLEGLRTIAGRIRGRHLLVVDLLGIALAAVVALTVRSDVSMAAADGGLLWVVIAVLFVRTLVNIRLGLYSHAWRYASVPDLERIVAALALGTLASFAAVGLLERLAPPLSQSGLPASFWLVELLVSFAVIAGARFGIRAVVEHASNGIGTASGGRRTLLFGAGRVGVMIARSARLQPSAGVVPVGFLDDDRELAGKTVAGLPVLGGLAELEQAIEETHAEALLITMPSAPGTAVRRILEAAVAQDIDVRTVPSVSDLLDGSIDAHRVRRVNVEDLLRRPLATEHAPAVQAAFRERTVVITGAAGSIGSELARQVLDVGPRRLVLVDQAESPLYLVQRDIEARRDAARARGEDQVPTEVVSHLASIASRAMMTRIMDLERPDVVLHAAAYKHVPMLEQHPSEAVQVNIGGTLALLDSAANAGVERFVLVSTDKAVRPSSVMGASKRIAEMLVADAARRLGRPYVSVRFGNVLGSNGSVVPIFQEQLEKGQPLTITDPEMTRYFMTIPEAAWLILDAAAVGESGDMFVLDMGEPVRVMDIARDLARLSGRDPDSVPIKIVGLRPGEKLHEELFYEAEQATPTEIPKVLRGASEMPRQSVREDVAQLLRMATGDREAELRQEIHRSVRQLVDDAESAPERPVAPERRVAPSPSGDPKSAGRRRQAEGAAAGPAPGRHGLPAQGSRARPAEDRRGREVVVVPVHGNGNGSGRKAAASSRRS
jgi:FlaA1/EpsC-like NDP-sugar epimerase